MLDLRLGDCVVYDGRTLTVCGFTPVSVDPPRVWLKVRPEEEDFVEVLGWEAVTTLSPCPSD